MMLERLEWDRTYKGSNPRGNLQLSDYRREKAAEMAKEAELELEAVRAEVVAGKETISAQAIQLADLSDALEKGAEEESRLFTKLDAKYAEFDEVTQKANLAESLIEYFKNTSASEREHEYFEKMLDLTYENQNLKSENVALKQENQTLKAKLQQAYDFMKQFTIGGVNMLEKFLRSIGEWVQQKVVGIGR